MSVVRNLRQRVARFIYPTAALQKALALSPIAAKTVSITSISSSALSAPPFSSLNPVASAHESTIKQLKFLLAGAPMIDVPETAVEAREWARRARSPFAYIHPKTMAKITFEPVKGAFIILRGAATKWVLTSLMPERRVIFSPLAIPGLEKILAE